MLSGENRADVETTRCTKRTTSENRRPKMKIDKIFELGNLRWRMALVKAFFAALSRCVWSAIVEGRCGFKP
jgi:hypothetical protein